MTATLFINLVTSDLLKKHLPLDDDGQPWCVWAACLLETSLPWVQSFSVAVKADGRKIRDGACAVHGITSRDVAKGGFSEVVVLGAICGGAKQVERVVGHGVSFDKEIVTSLLMRRDKPVDLWVRPGLAFYDTMTLSTPFCRLPREGGDDGSFKWPSLREASALLLNEEVPEGPQNPMHDVERVMRLWQWLVSNNAVEIAA